MESCKAGSENRINAKEAQETLKMPRKMCHDALELGKQARFLVGWVQSQVTKQQMFDARNVGCYPFCQRFRKFQLEFKWKDSFRFLLTGIFGITSGGGPHISVRPKFAVPFMTNRFFALIWEFDKRI